MRIERSKKPCKFCKKTEQTVKIREGDELTVVVCLEHLYEHVPEPMPKKPSSKAKSKDVPGQRKLVES